MRTKCTVKKHKKIQLPEGAFGPPTKVKEHQNPYYNIFVIGDLNKLFLEEGEEISDELREQNENEYYALQDRLRGDDYGDEDYGDEDDYGNEYGGEEYGEEEEE